MKVIPKRTFLLKQVEAGEGKVKDVIARKGEAIDVTEKEYRQFVSSFEPVASPPAKKK